MLDSEQKIRYQRSNNANIQYIYTVYIYIYDCPITVCTTCINPPQVNKVNGLKVLQTFIMYVGACGLSITLCEILHTTRDYSGYQMALLFIESQLSRFKAEAPGGVGGAMASRSLVAAFSMTDKDMASMNGISVQYNKLKYVNKYGVSHVSSTWVQCLQCLPVMCCYVIVTVVRLCFVMPLSFNGMKLHNVHAGFWHT